MCFFLSKYNDLETMKSLRESNVWVTGSGWRSSQKFVKFARYLSLPPPPPSYLSLSPPPLQKPPNSHLPQVDMFSEANFLDVGITIKSVWVGFRLEQADKSINPRFLASYWKEKRAGAISVNHSLTRRNEE